MTWITGIELDISKWMQCVFVCSSVISNTFLLSSVCRSRWR